MNFLKLMSWFNPGRWAMYLALGLSLWLGYQAWEHHQREIGRQEMREQYAKEAKAANDKRATVAAPIVAANAAATVQIRTVTKTILKEVPVYVQNSDCPGGLSGGFRLLHDAAANGELPRAAGGADAPGVEVEAVASTVAENYGACIETSRQLTDLQLWIREQQRLK